MKTNTLPKYDPDDKPTGCCARFDPAGWDDQELHFAAKPFVVARTKSIAHVPINMAKVFRDTFTAIENAKARDADDFLVLSRDLSAWSAEHLFAIAREVPGYPMVYLSGDYRTAVFEGPFKHVPRWARDVERRAQARRKSIDSLYFFYTTCPQCAKAYGKNYVVAFTSEHDAA